MLTTQQCLNTVTPKDSLSTLFPYFIEILVKSNLDPRLQTKSNFSKGSSQSEHPIMYAFELIIKFLGLSDFLEYHGNRTTYRGYIRAKGDGYDGVLYLKKKTKRGIHKIPLIFFEIKNWTDNSLTYNQSVIRVISRFKNPRGKKVLIQYNESPLKMTDDVKKKLRINEIEYVHIQDHYQLFIYIYDTISEQLQKNNLCYLLEKTRNKFNKSKVSKILTYVPTTCEDITNIDYSLFQANFLFLEDLLFDGG